jgi:hypothetical protein
LVKILEEKVSEMKLPATTVYSNEISVGEILHCLGENSKAKTP